MQHIDAKPAAKIRAIVCTYNRYDVLGDALASLNEQSLDRSDYEVIVVDNSSEKRVQTNYWRRHRDSFGVRLDIQAAAGLSHARNVGSRLASAPIVAYIDDDAVASPTWLETLALAFERSVDIGVAGGPVAPIWPDGQPKWLHPWLAGFYTIVERGGEDRILADAEWLAGTNIAFRRDLLIKVGGFDEGLGRRGGRLLSNEELETARRIHALGFRTFYSTAALVHHRVDEARVDQGWLRRRVAWQAVSDALASDGPERANRVKYWEKI